RKLGRGKEAVERDEHKDSDQSDGKHSLIPFPAIVSAGVRGESSGCVRLGRSSKLGYGTKSDAGERLRSLLRLLYWLAALVVAVIAAGIWWYVYRPLPTIDGTQWLAGLKQEVTVERDKWGVPHL